MKLKEVTAEPWEFIIERVDKQKQGIHVFYQGVPYPKRGYYDRLNDPNHNLRVLEALGIVKKFLFSLTYLPVIPRTINIKKWEIYFQRLLATCYWQLKPYLLKDDEWSVPVWEIGKLVENFLLNLGFTDKHLGVAKGYAQIIMCFLEFDNAYRYRVQDILGLYQFNPPRKEVRKLLKIYAQRESIGGASERLTKLGKVLSLMLWIPKIRKAFEKAISSIDLEKIKLDTNDRYHVSYWRGYNYFGQDFDTRYQFFLDTHKGDYPPFKKKVDPQLTANFLLGD